MEVAGSAASIIAVIDSAAKVVLLCTQYAPTAKNARPEIKSLQREVNKLETTLEGARELYIGSNSAGLQAAPHLLDVLSGCSSQLKKLETNLETNLNTRRMSLFGFRNLKWPFKSEEVDHIIKSLERYRNSIQMHVTEVSLSHLESSFYTSTLTTENADLTIENDALTIENDIAAFLEYKLAKIREDYKSLVHNNQQLLSDWPGRDFIEILAEPLSTSSLARLLDIPRAVVNSKLASLHSVLSAPFTPDSPGRMPHLSSSDFLVDSTKRDTNSFWVEEQKSHERIAIKCLRLLAASGHLKTDICNVKKPGTLRANIEPGVIDTSLPADVRYACLHWVYHLEQSNVRITDDHQSYIFLKEHFLHWLEALSLLGKISESVTMINTLQALIRPETGIDASVFLRDAARFILSCRSTIDISPLLVYSSPIIFAPDESVIRSLFKNYIPKWVSLLPKIDSEWNACLQTLEGHSHRVTAAAFSSDGKLIASASYDKTVRLWDAATGNHQWILEGHTGIVKAIAFSPNSKLLASASWDKTVQLWDTVTGTHQRTLEGHGSSVEAVAFSPDGKLLVSASLDKMIRLWDIATGTHQQTLGGHRHGIKAVMFSPNGKLLASASSYSAVSHSNKMIRLWDVATGAYQQTLGSHDGFVKAGTFSPNNNLVPSGSHDQTIRLWDAASGTYQNTLQGHSDSVEAIAFSPNGKLLASAFLPITAIVFSPDGKSLASASYDKTIKLWNPITGAHQQTLEGHSDCITAIAFSPNGKLLASASWDKTVRLWDIATNPQYTHTGGSRSTHRGHSGSIKAISFSPDGKTVASGSCDKTVRLWDAATGTPRKILKHSAEVTIVTFSPDGKLLASASNDDRVPGCRVQLWNVATGDPLHTLNGNNRYIEDDVGARHDTTHTTRITTVVFSPDGKLLASASYDKTVRLWNTATGAHQKTINHYPHSALKVAFSPNSKLLASACSDNTVRLWDMATGTPRQVFYGHSNEITNVTFSPNGKLLASASHDKTIRLWDATTGVYQQRVKDDNSIKTLKVNQFIEHLSFSKDGRHLKTDQGWLSLYSNLPNTYLNEEPSDPVVFFSDNWVTRDGNKLLWLPSNYRATCIALYGNSLVLGHALGHLTFLKFVFG